MFVAANHFEEFWFSYFILNSMHCMMLLHMSLHNSFKIKAEFASSSFIFIAQKNGYRFLPGKPFNVLFLLLIYNYTSSMKDAYWVLVLGTAC